MVWEWPRFSPGSPPRLGFCGLSLSGSPARLGYCGVTFRLHHTIRICRKKKQLERMSTQHSDISRCWTSPGRELYRVSVIRTKAANATHSFMPSLWRSSQNALLWKVKMLFYENSKTTRELILGSDATRGGGAEKASVSPPTLSRVLRKI